MKKLLFVCVLSVMGVLFSNATNAQQQKIGYFSEEKTLRLFGVTAQIDSIMQQFRLDSIGTEYERRANKFRAIDSLYKKDCKTAITGKSCAEALEDLNQQQNILANWYRISQRMADTKMAQLLFPYKQKIFDALKEVVAEQGYVFVLETESLSHFFTPPILDNLSIRVAKKLNLFLPKSVEDTWKKAELALLQKAKPAAPAAKKK
ncbi:MAG: OmpH family outer membrane protein [Sediminibacterium sp.]